MSYFTLWLLLTLVEIVAEAGLSWVREVPYRGMKVFDTSVDMGFALFMAWLLITP